MEPDHDLLVCADCRQLHSTGDTSGLTPEREADVLAGLDFHPFLIILDGDAGFMWRSCDACGALAGDRYYANVEG